MWGRLVGILLVAGLATVAATRAGSALVAASERPVGVTVRVEGVARRVPDSFLGFSVEWTELPFYEADGSAFARVLGLLRVAGGRVPLRIGGETADSTYWPEAGHRLPASAYVLDRDYFTKLGRLARAIPLSLMVDLNLVARSARMAQALAREVRRALPSSSVTGIEIGNEPDLYPIGHVGTLNVKPGVDSRFRWALSYGSRTYARDFGRYARAVGSVWPHVRYGGPAQATARTDFVRRLLPTGALSMLTLHRYEFNSCASVAYPTYPTQQKYLSAAVSRTFVSNDRWFVSIARHAGVPLRVTEFGAAVCAQPGLTNTYATALWAANTIFDMLAQGVDGINVHLRLNYLNSAVNASPTVGLIVNPLYYGMLLVTRTLGPGATLMRVAMTHAPANLSVWEVRDSHRTTRVLLLNESGRDVSVKLGLAMPGQATVQRMTAPAPGATTDVQFAGRSLNPTGQWTGAYQAEHVRGSRGVFGVNVPHYSAALLIATP